MENEHEKLIKDFKEYLEVKGYTERSVRGRGSYAGIFMRYVERNSLDALFLSNNDASDYQQYLSLSEKEDGTIKYKGASINANLAAVKTFYFFLKQKGLIMSNPFDFVDNVKVPYQLPRNILSIEQMEVFLKTIETGSADDLEFRTAVELLYATGMRINELGRLRYSDFDPAEGTLMVREDKSRSDRLTVLPEYTLKLFKIYCETAGLKGNAGLFRQQPDGLRKFVNRRLKKHSRSLKMPEVTCHCIRHSIATHLLKSGADIREVQRFLGHRNISNTEIYTHLCMEDLKAVIEKCHPLERSAQ